MPDRKLQDLAFVDLTELYPLYEMGRLTLCHCTLDINNKIFAIYRDYIKGLPSVTENVGCWKYKRC